MSTSGGFGLADGCYPIPPALQLVKRFIVGHSAAGARAQGLEVAALLRGSMRPFGLDGLGGAAKHLLDRPACRGLAERFLRPVEQFQVKLDRGALDGGWLST